MKAKPATIKDVAARAGVSFSTVARVLNDSRLVSNETKERVTKAARDLNYRPNRAAKLLRGGRSHSLGLLVGARSRKESGEAPRRLPTYIGDVMTGILQECGDDGYHLVIESVDPLETLSDTESEDDLRRFLESVRLDGVILVPPHCDAEWALDLLDECEVAYARINPGTNLDRSLCLIIDNFAAASQIGELFLRHNHRRIGFVAGPETHAAQGGRTAGFLSAVAREASATVQIHQGDFWFSSGVGAGRDLLSLGPAERPTAIFAANDEMAAGVLTVAQELGIRVPEELSIFGFGGLNISEHTWPRLSTVVPPTIEIAQTAAKELILNAKKPRDLNRTITFPYEIVVRASFGDAPSSEP